MECPCLAQPAALPKPRPGSTSFPAYQTLQAFSHLGWKFTLILMLVASLPLAILQV